MPQLLYHTKTHSEEFREGKERRLMTILLPDLLERVWENEIFRINFS